MSSTLRRGRFTTAEYARMASILAGRRTDLIDREIIEIAPIGTAFECVAEIPLDEELGTGEGC